VGETGEAAGAVQPAEATAVPATPAPSATSAPAGGRRASRRESWQAREQRAAQRAAERAAGRTADPSDDPSADPSTDPSTEPPSVETEEATAPEPPEREPAPETTARIEEPADAADAEGAHDAEDPDDLADTDAAPEEPETEGSSQPGFSLGNLTPFLLFRAAHPRQALVTAVGMTVAAALAGRPSRELLLILATVVVGQVILGWFNDLVDRSRDARHKRTGKPLADGRLEPGTVWFCLALAIFLVVPLSIANGLYAGSAYLISLAIGLLGQWVWLRKGFFSWLPWAAAYALYPAFLSYGGWGGQEKGAPPELLITGLAALLGIGVHLLTALWGLVPDNEDRWTYLPLKLGLKIGASRLLWLAGTYTVLVLVGLAFAGTHVGLAQEPL
jgi:4-hydroxybenzoate polyprenyltransferase